ncbi:hypothetical protein ACFVR2_19965 [Gottfriedia sp. NPDC057991]|uniref:hypothetical protein n=1 Tax=Gottfriedia sp. NPDC057991 TaxID=3346298 RepID=UPI0036D925F6
MVELLLEIENFRVWAKTSDKSYGEWETDYLHWDRIYKLVDKLLIETPVNNWNSELLNEFQYILARDNECEIIIDSLIENPKQLISIAQHTISFPDFDARWQVAYGLGEIDGNNLVIQTLLEKFLMDEMECVRKRASYAYEKRGY